MFTYEYWLILIIILENLTAMFCSSLVVLDFPITSAGDGRDYQQSSISPHRSMLDCANLVVGGDDGDEA